MKIIGKMRGAVRNPADGMKGRACGIVLIASIGILLIGQPPMVSGFSKRGDNISMGVKCSPRNERDWEICQAQWKKLEHCVENPVAPGPGQVMPKSMRDLSENLCSYFFKGDFGFVLDELSEIGISFLEFYTFMGCNPLYHSINQLKYQQAIEIIEQLEEEGATREFIYEAIYTAQLTAVQYRCTRTHGGVRYSKQTCLE